MPSVTVSKEIAAPVEKVFTTVASISEFQKAIPHIISVEILSDVKEGVGTKFKETREMRGKEASTVLEVTEHVPNERVRIVSDAGGSIWDTVFTTKTQGDGTVLTMVMDARPHKFLARLFVPMVMKSITRAIAKDMDAVKSYCEGGNEG